MKASLRWAFVVGSIVTVFALWRTSMNWLDASRAASASSSRDGVAERIAETDRRGARRHRISAPVEAEMPARLAEGDSRPNEEAEPGETSRPVDPPAAGR